MKAVISRLDRRLGSVLGLATGVSEKKERKMTPIQAANALDLLHWRGADLADISGVGLKAVEVFLMSKGATHSASDLAAMRRSFLEAGIDIPADPTQPSNLARVEPAFEARPGQVLHRTDKGGVDPYSIPDALRKADEWEVEGHPIASRLMRWYAKKAKR